MLELIDPATEMRTGVWAVAACVLAGARRFHRARQVRQQEVRVRQWRRAPRCDHLGRSPGEPGPGSRADRSRTTPGGLPLGLDLPLQPPRSRGRRSANGPRDARSPRFLGLWAATALLLSAAALAGNTLLAGAPDTALGLIRSFAGGAVVASLATEVFPKAFKEDSYATGIATALGLVLAIALDQLG